MAVRSADEIYKVITKALTGATEPMTCSDLMNVPEVREEAIRRFSSDIQDTTNKVSNLLGLMWRREVVEKHGIDRNDTRARFGYLLKKPKIGNTKIESKRKFEVREENGAIVIEFSDFVLTVKAK